MTFDKNNPFLATLIERDVLNKPGSKKCTLHIALDISGSHFKYKVGDSIAVYPENSPILVKETLLALEANASEIILNPRTGEEITFSDFLTKKVNLARVTKKWIQFASDHSIEPKEKEFLSSLLNPENKEKLKIYIEEHHLWDFLKEIKSLKANPKICIEMFSPLLPRFYSIASSQSVHPNRIDLIIAYFNYTTNQHLRHGVASHYLCEMAQMHSPSIPIYIHPSKGFTIPEDASKSIIMIGPGTGVAPFRGFIQERVEQKATGKNWLFFGDWNEGFDFYHKDFWKKLEREGFLKLSTAFSRDQPEKIYVQHKMLLEAPEIWKWINQGAIIYVCGDAIHMAKDVDQALHTILEEQGKMTPEESKSYIKQMRDEDRYLRDVY